MKQSPGRRLHLSLIACKPPKARAKGPTPRSHILRPAFGDSVCPFKALCQQSPNGNHCSSVVLCPQLQTWDEPSFFVVRHLVLWSVILGPTPKPDQNDQAPL